MVLSTPNSVKASTGTGATSQTSSSISSSHHPVNFHHGNAPNRLANPPAFIEYQELRFLVMDAPSDGTLPLYIKEFMNCNVTSVVRVCDPTYNKHTLTEANIAVHDWPFGDGKPPPPSIVDQWLDLIESTFVNQSPPPCVAVHCVAGLGRFEWWWKILILFRAPVLVAIALIERGMSALDSVAYIRERRRGAINNAQLKYLETYKRRSKQKCSIC